MRAAPSDDGRTTIAWMSASMCVALALVLLVGVEADRGKLGVALRVTARWSFILFWLGYTGRSLASLFGSRFQALAQHARDFGLAFASAHSVHVGLVAWLLYSSTEPILNAPLIFFGIAVFWVYLLAILSIRRVSAMLPSKMLRILRIVGVEYIALAFLLDFFKSPFKGGILNLIAYLPFQLLAVLGLLLRLTAGLRRLTLPRRFVAT